MMRSITVIITRLPDQPLGRSDGTGREIADERLTQSMSLTEDEHHHEQTEQPLIKRALTEDELLEQTDQSLIKLQPTQPLSKDGALENFVGLTIKNLARFEGVRIMEDVDKSPKRARQQ